jgi:hypothetical protein
MTGITGFDFFDLNPDLQIQPNPPSVGTSRYLATTFFAVAVSKIEGLRVLNMTSCCA